SDEGRQGRRRFVAPPFGWLNARWPAERGIVLALLARAGQVVAAGPSGARRGKSGLRRAGCWLTASRGDSRDSATENRPPAERQARVKRCGKSAPRRRRRRRHGKPHLEQEQIGERRSERQRWPAALPGRLARGPRQRG